VKRERGINMTNISADLLKPFYDLLIVELESEVNENEK